MKHASIRLAASLVALTLLPPHTTVAAADKAGPGSCNIAAHRFGFGSSTVTCIFGVTPEQLKQVTEAAVKGATEPLTRQNVDISRTLGVTKDTTENLLKIVGENTKIPDVKLPEALTKVASDYESGPAQVVALNPDNPTAKTLVEQAKPEIEAGHFGRVHELLRQATQAQIAAALEAEKSEQQAHASRDAQMLGAASSTAVDGDVAVTERRYLEAAGLFGQAASYVPDGHSGEQGGYLLRQAEALYRQGGELGDNNTLRLSIEVCGRALAEYQRSEFPLEWGMTQSNLGLVLERLGERESGTARLEEAVVAYRAALEELTRDHLPLDWERTQNHLASALTRLGERESGTARLEEAVAAYRLALQERTRERVPLDWATRENNLGNALARLGERESGTARLQEAVATYRLALQERIRERVPLDWAMTQNNLGNALARLGERESGTETLQNAVAAYRAALEEWTRERIPLEWAATHMNLSNALEALAERQQSAELMEEAVMSMRDAVEVYQQAGAGHWLPIAQKRAAEMQAELAELKR
jgi:tetratricopeptide (TPR) repeat protein